MSSRLIKQENSESHKAGDYFRRKSNSVKESADIAVPVNQSHDNIFTKKLDILIEQEFEHELDAEQDRLKSDVADATAVFDCQDHQLGEFRNQ